MAEAYNITVDQIVEWNEIADVQKVYEGQNLIVKIVGNAPKRPPKKPLPAPDPELKKLLTQRGTSKKLLGKKLKRWKHTGVRNVSVGQRRPAAPFLPCHAKTGEARESGR